MDDRILCFKINDRELFLEENLVNFNDIPIFFVCKDKMGYRYTVQCIDTEELSYYIARVLDKNLVAMLEGEISISKLMVDANEKWKVESGDTIESDSVKDIENFEKDSLPKEDAYFTLSNPEINNFKERLKLNGIYLDVINFERKTKAIIYTSKSGHINYDVSDIWGSKLKRQLIAAVRKFANPEHRLKNDISRNLLNNSIKKSEKIFGISNKKHREKDILLLIDPSYRRQNVIEKYN